MFLVQSLVSILVHAFTFFLCIQIAYTSLHIQDGRTWDTDLSLRSLSGFFLFIPFFLFSLLQPLLRVLKEVDGSSTSSDSWQTILRRGCFLSISYLLAMILAAPIIQRMQGPWMAPETQRRGSSTLTSISSRTMTGLIAVGLLYYLVRVFTFTEHLNHIYTMATSGIVGAVVVLGVLAWMFTTGFLFWTQEKILQGLLTISTIALVFLPWWALRSSALTTPGKMIEELFFRVKSPEVLFPWLCWVGHFTDFFLLGSTGWKAWGLTRGQQWIHVMFYLAGISLPWTTIF